VLFRSLEAEFLGAVEGIARREGELRLARAALGGKALEWWSLPTPLVLTVQPGAFPAPETPPVAPGMVEEVALASLPTRARVLGLAGGGDEDGGLARAQVVVAAGRGIGPPENLELIRRLAALFSQGAVAGSRPICDLGWLPYRCQVGMTGATVTPRLYIACGISGATQHTVGMQGAGFIVAVNSDPHAAIFNLADVGVVEDLSVFLPALLELAEGAS
jgi:electron transfer flavoprotein alpha subunit